MSIFKPVSKNDTHFRSPKDPGILLRDIYYFEGSKTTFTLGVYDGLIVFGPLKKKQMVNTKISDAKKNYRKQGFTVTKLDL